MQEICSREQRGDGMMIFWCRINDPLQLFAFLSSFSVSCRAHLPWEEEPLVLAVSGEELLQQSVSATIPCPSSKGPVVGLRELPATGPGWVVPWCERHSLVTACEHERYFLIFSSALFAFMQPIRKGWRNCFWILLHHLQYDFFSVWQESQFSSLENASEIFFY